MVRNSTDPLDGDFNQTLTLMMTSLIAKVSVGSGPNNWDSDDDGISDGPFYSNILWSIGMFE